MVMAQLFMLEAKMKVCEGIPGGDFRSGLF